MPLKLAAPIIKEFVLEESDKKYGDGETETTVTIRQAAQHAHMVRQDFFSELERKYNQGETEEVSIVQRFALEELKRLEVWLTMVDCNILDEDGKALFPSKKGKNDFPRLAMQRRQFEENWGLLPPDVAEEIHDKVLEVNLFWAPEGEA